MRTIRSARASRRWDILPNHRRERSTFRAECTLYLDHLWFLIRATSIFGDAADAFRIDKSQAELRLHYARVRTCDEKMRINWTTKIKCRRSSLVARFMPILRTSDRAVGRMNLLPLMRNIRCLALSMRYHLPTFMETMRKCTERKKCRQHTNEAETCSKCRWQR